MNTPNPCLSRFDSRGITLVELLVLLGISGLLIAVMIPVGGTIRGHARGATCASNLGTMMNGMYLYADDHEGQFPPPSGGDRMDLPLGMNTWHAYLAPYAGLNTDLAQMYSSGITWRSNSKELTALSCPTSMTELIGLPNADRARLNPWFMYGLNADLPSRALGRDRRSGINIGIDDLKHPAQTMAILETSDWSAMFSREIGDSTGTGAALIPHGMAANVAFYDGSVRRIPHEELIAYESTSVFWAGGYAN